MSADPPSSIMITNHTDKMSDEPWDEMMGPPSTFPTMTSFQRDDHRKIIDPPADDDDDEPFIRTNSTRTYEYQMPDRWSQYDHDTSRYEKEAATAQAVYLAANSLAEREYDRYGDDRKSVGSISDDDEYTRAIKYSSSRDPYAIKGSSGSFKDSTGSIKDSFHSIKEPSSNNSIGSASSTRQLDHENIRQEALRMLEVADADEHYSVYKTVSGGYSAAPKTTTTTKKSKVRAALSGIRWSGRNKNNRGRFRDRHPYDDDDIEQSTDDHEIDHINHNNDDDDDMEYGEAPVVDVVAMERRSLANNEKESKSNWSSRYTIDKTLLAMSGGTISQSSVSNMRIHNDPWSTPNVRILDRMDREHRSSSSSLSKGNHGFMKGAIFGSGEAFNYRQNHVFGKQNVVLPPPPSSSRQPNLQAAFIEPVSPSSSSSLPPVNARTKTWQEKLYQKRLQTRILLVIGGLLIIFIITFGTVMARQKFHHTTATQSVTFYVTSDVPLKVNDESTLHRNFQSLSSQTKFVVHVGNIQTANATQCIAERYMQVADMFSTSCQYPMYVIPGKDDWNECPDPNAAWNNWYNAFSLFNQKFANYQEITTYYQKDHVENWAFLESGVLFIGVNVIDGTVLDTQETKIRNDNSFNWIMGMMTSRQKDFRSVVIFGNAAPGTAPNVNFFAPLGDLLSDQYFVNVPALYVFAASGSTTPGTLYQPLNNVPNLQAVPSTPGGTVAPLRINVGFGTQPFILG